MSVQPAPGDDAGLLAAQRAAIAVLRASADALLDPCVLLEAARDPSGRIVDFCFRQVNQATCDYIGLSRAELVGRSITDGTPGIKDAMLPALIRCLDNGDPLIVNDFAYDNEFFMDTRRYDLRANRATASTIVVTWRDVTERYRIAQRLAASEALYRGSMDNAAVGMCLATPDGRFADVNNALCRFVGYEAQTLMTMTWQDLLAPEYLEGGAVNIERMLSGEVDSYRFTRQFIHADGHRIWGDMSLGCLRKPDGQVEYLIAQVTDVTNEVALTEALRQQNKMIADSEATYRLLAENAGDLVCHTRQDGTGGNRIAWISPNVKDVLGASPEHWLGRPLLEFVAAEDVQAHADRWQKVGAGGVVSQRVRMRSVDGAAHWFHVNVKPFFDAEGNRDGAVIAAHLVDEEVAAEQATEEANRQKAIADERFRRSMENAAVGMCLMSAEGRVEEVNQQMCRFLGYEADTLLQMTWDEVTDPDYREENWTNINAMLKGRSDSYRMINQYVHADGHQIWGDHSVTCIRDAGGRLENFLIQVTDVTPVERELRERLEFGESLSSAIADGRLVAYAQPIVDARSGEVVEEELLVRMVGIDGQVMVPDEFLPQARRFGMMPTIDRFMLTRAIELARAGRRVDVNISAASINDAATMSAIVEELRQAGDVAGRLSFEITEHTALASTELAERFSEDMRRLGCRLALDDFGTGFGSFTELRGMAVNKLKIDQSFVFGLLRNPQDESVVRAIIDIAREFGLLTTAEGVEDAAIRDRLVELGVDQLQGYLVGRPAPVTLAAVAATD
ncbi:MAG: PAS domain S-box protein [Mycobacterium sp.]|nr:PAS domain S-box protein [Mycobacterium sp.]